MPKADDIKSETGEEECVNKPTNSMYIIILYTLSLYLQKEYHVHDTVASTREF